MSSTHQQPRFALLIGAGDYRAFDDSMRNPPGTSALQGAAQDVGSMYSLCLALGIEPENIYVLLSPTNGGDPKTALRAAYANADPATIGRATRDNIFAGLEWLARRLESSGPSSDPPPALVTWSGHADFSGGELALCPSDVTSIAAEKDLRNVIGFDELRPLFARASMKNTTLVLDCCHSGAVTHEGRRPSLTGRGSKFNGEPICARTIAATDGRSLAEQSTFDGVSHGAFTWALKVVADQWKAKRWKGADEISISYGQLRQRIDQLLGSLSFEQRAQLGGGEEIAKLPLFHRGALDGDASSAKPDRARRGVQLEPDPSGSFVHYVVTVFDSTGLLVFEGNLISTTTGSTYSTNSYAADTEYLIQPSEPKKISSSSPGTDWNDLVTYNGPLTLAKIEYTPTSIASWDPTDPFSWGTALALGPSGVTWSDPSSTSPLAQFTQRFYHKDTCPAPADEASAAICVRGVALTLRDNSPSFVYTLFATDQPPANSYVVRMNQTNVFDYTSPPALCPCCESPASCQWYQPS